MARTSPASMGAAPTTAQGKLFQNRINEMQRLQAAFNTVNSMSGKYTVSSITSASATEKFTDALSRERMTIGTLVKSRKLYNAALREQIALQNASVVQFGRNSRGQTMSSVLVPNNFIPRDFRSRMAEATTRVGMFGQAMKSAGSAGGEWARGMQRTGFQITQGIGVPLAAMAAVAGTVFYQVDKQLTDIAKVYDTTADSMMGKEKELSNLREGSIRNAQNVAKQYGSTVTSTLQVEAALAATGLKGVDLMKATTEVQRASILGDLDQQDALKTTISIQSIYQKQAEASGDSSKYLADQFNFMNQVENQTVLSMKDMTEAFPKILPVIKTMGGTVQDAAIFLTGFKQNGISATEGANAFRTGINRLINPAKTVSERLRGLGVEIDDIGTEAGGNPLKMLEILAERMKGLSALEKQQAVGKLFGSYQVARMTALIDSLGTIKDVNEQTGEAVSQVGRAYQAAQQSGSEWAKTSDTEMARLQQSASMKFKKMISIIQGQLISFGQPVLELATSILTQFSKFLDFFNKLPDASKKFLIIATVGTIVGGAVLLVVGAFANLLYTMMRVGGSLLTFATNFRTLSAAQLAAATVTNEAVAAQNAEAGALANTTTRLAAFTAAARAAAAAQLGLNTASQRAASGVYAQPLGPASPQYRSAIGPVPAMGPVSSRVSGPQPANGLGLNGGYMQNGTLYQAQQRKNGNGLNYYVDGKRGGTDTAGYRAAQASAQEADAARRMSQATKETARNQAKVAAAARAARMDFMTGASAVVGIAMAASAMSQISKDGKVTAQSGLLIALTVASLVPALTAVGTAMKAINFATIATAIRTGTAAMAAFLGPIGLAVIAAAALGAAIYMINRKMGETARNAKIINDSTQTWADLLGYTSTAMDNTKDATAKTTAKQMSNQDRLKESNEDLYNALKKVRGEEEKVARARGEALKVVASGGNAQSAEAAMRTALSIMGIRNEKQDMVVKANMDVVIDNPEEAKKKLIADTSNLMQEAVDEVNKRSWVFKVFDPMGMSGDAKEAAILAAGSFNSAFASEVDNGSKSQLLAGFIDNWNRQSAGVFAGIKNKNDNAAIFSDLGIKNMTDLNKALGQAAYEEGEAEKARVTGKKSTIEANNLTKQRAKLLEMVGKEGMQSSATEATLAKTIAENNGITGDALINIRSLDDLWKALDLTFGAVPASAAAAGDGLAATGDDAEGAAEQVDGLSEANKKLVDSLNDARKQTMNGIMEAVYAEAARQREKQQQDALDKLEASGEARLDRLDGEQERRDAEFDARQEAGQKDFENRQKAQKAAQDQENKDFEKSWDAQMDKHDQVWKDKKDTEDALYQGRIDGIEAAITAEEKAEDTRQRIFEKEKARIERLSEMYNRNVDFNAALNSGNLDEAAKISNDGTAQSLQWASDDSSAVAGTGSQQRVDALNAQKDEVEKQKDARLEQIDAEEEAEKKQLEDRKDREKELIQARQDAADDQLKNEQETWSKSLDQERTAFGKSMEARRKSITEQNSAAQKAAQDRFDMENRSIEMQLAVLKAATPRTQAELETNIANLRGVYNQFGSGYLDPTSKAWGKLLGDATSSAVNTAAATLRDTINWEDIGAGITNEMAGAFDINGDQLIDWLKTGVFPGGSDSAAAPVSQAVTGGRPSSNGFSGGITRHTGGPVSWSSADRVGVPRSASPYPSEVPALLKRGEFVVNERASRTHAGLLAELNAGNGEPVIRHAGGFAGGGPAAGGLIGAAVGKAIARGIANQLSASVAGMISQPAAQYGTAAAGKYSSTSLNGEQLQNASIIMNVGKSMGASNRDLVVSLMTAMQESGLKNLNYGDRDSIGLFQQRPSQGWGTVAQIMDPKYSARKFFDELFRVNKKRPGLSNNDAAQAVQRSGFANAYAKWESMANAIVNGTPAAASNVAFKAGSPAALAAMAAQNGFTSGGGAGGVDTAGIKYSGTTTWPAMKAIMEKSGVPFQVTSTTGGNHAPGSYHYKGQAIDLDDFSSPRVDTPGLMAIYKWIKDHFGANASELIYAGPGATSLKDGQAHTYSKATMDGHHNHVHWAMSPAALAKIGVPQLNVGGNIKYDNTLANLHKGETVLTAPLSAGLERGIDNMSGSGEININFHNPIVREDADIDALVGKVKSALRERDQRNGISRTVRGK